MRNPNVMSEPSTDIDALRDDELDNVNGGLVVIAIIAILIGQLLPAVQKTREQAQ